MTTSSPPTPPARPVRDDERRFKTLTLPCEWIEDYRPGGYHPVNLGDLFNDGQYKIIRKLGEGSYSTVWLANDLRNKIYTALKIFVSEVSEKTNEEQILSYLATLAEGKRYTTQLLSEFEHKGPNGNHKCLVFEVMGPNANVMVEELPQFKPRRREMKVRYPPAMAKSILKQALQALAFLHANGIGCGDLQPGNMLFGVDGIGSLSEDKLWQAEGTGPAQASRAVERLDGRDDPWAPSHLYVAQPLAQFTPYDERLKIKLSDMGGAYFLSDPPPSKLITPDGLRAPELVFAGKTGTSLDVWSFGCLLFELLTGAPLFCVPGSGHEDDDLALSLIDRLGALPEECYEAWETAALYVRPDRTLFNCRLGGVRAGEEPLMVPRRSMEEVFDEAGPDLDEDERARVKELIRWILQYDVAKRPSADEILLHPWFQAIKLGDDL